MTRDRFTTRVDWWRLRMSALGLVHWDFEYEWSEKVTEKSGHDSQAAVRVHHNYDTAYWDVAEATLELSNEEIDKIILHELMHIALRDLNRVEFNMLVAMGPQSEYYGEQLDAAIEALVERLARSIFDLGRNLVP